MEKILLLPLIFVFALVLNVCNSKIINFKDNYNKLFPKEEFFFVQKLPSLILESFSPDLVSTEDLEIEAATFLNMKKFYFVRQRKDVIPKSLLIYNKDNKWQELEEERL
ncbi:hypothetical protein [Gillisia sp. CAL575]|uniref:hypothetical protein n=1 Tax=Gillisia sp. CAL575 TaxID=985255 RepID=UPI00055683E1|nr:hypothetical protein [Gillisia sp. CAL575]